MDRLTVKAPAKLNLSLDVCGVREDGYHILKMIMQTIDLCDYVTVATNQKGSITIRCDRADVPLDNQNIAYRCAAAFFEETQILNCGVEIDIQKHIPSQAGLGGGSADGAATLVALNELFDAGLSKEELCDIGVACGADIPFCIMGGTMLAEGVGDIFTPLPSLPEDCWFVVAKPGAGISTAEAYRAYDQKGARHRPDHDQLVAEIVSGNLEQLGQSMHNVLEEVVRADFVQPLKQTMDAAGALGSMMTGSGSAVFGLFDNKRKASRCENQLEDCADQVFLCQPLEHGAVICKEN